MSKGLLKQISWDGLVDVYGFPWQDNHQALRLPISRLTSSVLCRRHNNAFGRLDMQAALFIKALMAISGLTATALKPAYLFSGEDIQRWMYKSMFSLVAAKCAQGPKQERIEIGSLSREDFNSIFSETPPVNWKLGLHVLNEPGAKFMSTRSLSVKPLLDAKHGTLWGMEFRLASFAFLITTQANVNVDGGLFRPRLLSFRKDDRTISEILLSWNGPHSENGVVFNAVFEQG